MEHTETREELILRKAAEAGLCGLTQSNLNQWVWGLKDIWGSDKDEPRPNLKELDKEGVEVEVKKTFESKFCNKDDQSFSEQRLLALRYLGAKLDQYLEEEHYYARLVGDYGNDASRWDRRDRIVNQSKDLSCDELASFWMEMGEELLRTSTYEAWDEQGFVLLHGVELPCPYSEEYLKRVNIGVKRLIPTHFLISQGYQRWAMLERIHVEEETSVDETSKLWIRSLLRDSDSWSLSELNDLTEEEMGWLKELLVKRFQVGALYVYNKEKKWIGEAWGIL